MRASEPLADQNVVRPLASARISASARGDRRHRLESRARAWHCFHGPFDTDGELMPTFRQWLLRDGLHCMPELGTQGFRSIGSCLPMPCERAGYLGRSIAYLGRSNAACRHHPPSHRLDPEFSRPRPWVKKLRPVLLDPESWAAASFSGRGRAPMGFKDQDSASIWGEALRSRMASPGRLPMACVFDRNEHCRRLESFDDHRCAASPRLASGMGFTWGSTPFRGECRGDLHPSCAMRSIATCRPTSILPHASGRNGLSCTAATTSPPICGCASRPRSIA